jgi:hypothetical protein
MFEYLPIFATPIFKASLDIPEGALTYWLQKSELTEGVNRSNRGGWQSEPADHDPYILPIKSFLTQHLPAFRMGSTWVNINRKNNENVAHCHPGADLVYTWYLTDAEGLQLRNPNVFSQWQILKEFNHEDGNVYDTINFSFAAGDIIVFPASIDHSVRPHQGDDPRVSVSGNLHWRPPVTAESEAVRAVSELAPLNL